MKLLINVGGKGTRLAHLTHSIPKPMIEVAGKPVLEHLVEWAAGSGFTDILLLCGYKHEIISDYFGDGSRFGIPIVYSIEPRPLGSGGPIKFAGDLLSERFAYISGDLLCQVGFAELLKSHEQSGAIMTVTLHETSHPEDSDILQVGANRLVTKFVSKHDDHTDAGNLGNAGLCVMEPQVLDFMEEDVFTLETYLYPRLLEAGESLNAYVTEETIMDMGTPARLQKAENLLAAQ